MTGRFFTTYSPITRDKTSPRSLHRARSPLAHHAAPPRSKVDLSRRDSCQTKASSGPLSQAAVPRSSSRSRASTRAACSFSSNSCVLMLFDAGGGGFPASHWRRRFSGRAHLSLVLFVIGLLLLSGSLAVGTAEYFGLGLHAVHITGARARRRPERTDGAARVRVALSCAKSRRT